MGLARRLAPELPLLASVLLISCFYLWTASGGWPFEIGVPHDGHYNLLTNALVRGQLHLTVEPRPEMFETSEPYEPKNGPYRLHDASLYHGRYYLYFGIVPALLLFVPWSLVGLGDLPETLAAAVFASGGFAFSCLLLRHLLRAHLGQRPRWMEGLAYVTIGLANVAPFILRAPLVYEVAIAGGYCFLAGSAWLFASANGVRGRSRLWRLAGGGLSLGLAVGCRPNLLVALPFLPILAWRDQPADGERRGRAAPAVLAPLAFCFLLLGTYNALRFGSPLEFGTRYQLAGVRPIAWLDPRAILPTLFFDFLAPPAARLEFPFFFPSRDYPWPTPAGYFKDTATTGALAHSPFLLLLLGAPVLLRCASGEARDRLRRDVAVLVAVGLLTPLATSYAFASAAMRFQVDFVSFLIVPALLLWFLGSRLENDRLRRIIRYGGLLAILWSCLVNLSLSLSGASNGLERDNPALFARLAKRFEPLRIGLGRILDRDGRVVVRLRGAFPERLSADSEPLLTSGTATEYDVLSVRQQGPGSFAFSLETAHGEKLAAAPARLQPGRFYAAEVDLDRVARRVVVRLDGAEVARFEARLAPARTDTIWLGRGPKGRGAVDIGHFSGSLVSQAMIWAGLPGLDALPPLSVEPAIFTETAEERPSAAVAGQLWVPAGRDGAYLFVGPGWRWVPRHFVDRVRVERAVEIADLPPGAVEPVLVSGDEAGADGVYLRHEGPGRLAFGLARWHSAWDLGTAGSLTEARPGRTRTLSVLLDRPGRQVIVLLDGQVVLRAAADLRAIDRSLLYVGKSPPGMTLGRPTFGGRIWPGPTRP